LGPVDLLVAGIQEITTSLVVQAFLAACIGFLLTVGGALPALVGIGVREKTLAYGMGFAAGTMISASFTSLLMPALEVGGVIPATAGFLVGALVVHIVNSLLPHEHVTRGYEGPEKLKRKLKVAWLIAFAMIIHNIPEGAAVGAAMVESTRGGVLLAIAIGIQNMPEGLATVLPLISLKRDLKQAIVLVMLSGVVEPVAAAGAAMLVTTFRGLLPYMLSFAAGAMMYVVSHEIIPETHEEGREIRFTAGLMVGLILMLVLDAYYG